MSNQSLPLDSSSFVDLFSNRVILGATDVRLNPHVPFATELTDPEARLGTLIHELTHHWCFDTPVGNALAMLAVDTLRIAQNRLDSYTRYRRHLVSAYSKFNLVLQVYQPVIEGLALFLEFDSDVWDDAADKDLLPPLKLARTFLPSDQGHTTWLRGGAAAEKRTELLAMSPQDEADGPYILGYTIIKSIWREHCIRGGFLADPSNLAEYIRSMLFEDDKLVWLLLEQSDRPLSEIIAHINRRLRWLITSGERWEAQLAQYRYGLSRAGYLTGLSFGSDLSNYSICMGLGLDSSEGYVLTRGRTFFAIASQDNYRPATSERVLGVFSRGRISADEQFTSGFLHTHEHEVAAQFIARRSLVSLIRVEGELQARPGAISFSAPPNQGISMFLPPPHPIIPYSGPAEMEALAVTGIGGVFHRFLSWQGNLPTAHCVTYLGKQEIQLRHGKTLTINEDNASSFISNEAIITHMREYEWKKWRAGIADAVKFYSAKRGVREDVNCSTCWRSWWDLLFSAWFNNSEITAKAYRAGVIALVGGSASRLRALASAGLERPNEWGSSRDNSAPKNSLQQFADQWHSDSLSIYPHQPRLVWL
jgi:hypothetical protein